MSPEPMWIHPSPHPRRSLRTCALVVAALLLCGSACDDDLTRHRPRRQTTMHPVPSQPAQPRAAQPGAARTATAPSDGEFKSIEAPALIEHMRAQGKRGTVVNVWASWCGSCKGEVPMLLQLRGAFPELDFVFVSADELPDVPKAVALMREWSGPLPVLAVTGPMTPFKRAMHPTWRGAIPATFLFDDAQRRRHFWEGPILEHEISPILQGYLAGEPIDGETRPPLAGPNE
jgi:thiol-disulfide isomerase/thioredoxin